MFDFANKNGFQIFSFYNPNGLPVDYVFIDLSHFSNYLLEKGLKLGIYFIQIGDKVYDIYLPKNIDPVFRNNG